MVSGGFEALSCQPETNAGYGAKTLLAAVRPP